MSRNFASRDLFESIKVGLTKYTEGGLFMNNSVATVYAEASEMFQQEDLVLVSLGTGSLATKTALGAGLLGTATWPKDITPFSPWSRIAVSGLEKCTKERGFEHQRFQINHGLSCQYFRFNVPGIGDISFEETKNIHLLKQLSEKYLYDPSVKGQLLLCVQQLAKDNSNSEKLPLGSRLVRNALTVLRSAVTLDRARATVVYRVDWNISRFLNIYFPEGQRLGSILTLTGDANGAQAVPCAEYLQTHWPDVGVPLLHAIESMLDASTIQQPSAEILDVKIAVKLERAAEDNPSAKPGSITVFTINATFNQHFDIALAISWLCAALRHGDTEGLSMSGSYVEVFPNRRDIPGMFVRPRHLTPVSVSKACWHSIFTHTVIAQGFPIRARKEGRGLELSFWSMITLARALRLTLYSDGLVAEGPDSLLIPTKELREDDALQWHLEMKTSRPLVASKEYHMLGRQISWRDSLAATKLRIRKSCCIEEYS
jgi:hypothetical protein